MSSRDPGSLLRVQLSPERRAGLVRSFKRYFAEQFDESISEFRAEGILDFCLKEIGPSVYNQGVADATRYMQERLGELDGFVYERER